MAERSNTIMIQNTSNNYLRPQWCIDRGNGCFVPLIPADELPVRLEGVGRLLLKDQTVDMTCVGLFPPTGRSYIVDGIDAAPCPTGRLRQATFAAPVIGPYTPVDWTRRDIRAVTPAPNLNAPATTGMRTVDVTSSVGTAYGLIQGIPQSLGFSAARRETTPPSGVRPDQSKKEFCTYWIETGRCKYMQQGCRFKHIMPTDLDLLAALGFDGFPQWWQREHNVDKRGNPRTYAHYTKAQWRPLTTAGNDGQQIGKERETGFAAGGIFGISPSSVTEAPSPAHEMVHTPAPIARPTARLGASNDTSPTTAQNGAAARPITSFDSFGPPAVQYKHFFPQHDYKGAGFPTNNAQGALPKSSGGGWTSFGDRNQRGRQNSAQYSCQTTTDKFGDRNSFDLLSMEEDHGHTAS